MVKMETSLLAGHLRVLGEVRNSSLYASTGRNFEEYAFFLGFSESELWNLIGNKNVMDLGSGLGGFGADVAFASSFRSSVELPKRLDMVDFRYAFSDYQKRWQEEVQEDEEIGIIFAVSLPQVLGYKRISVRYDDMAARSAMEESGQWRQAVSWNNLSKLPNDYDVIVSSFAFPYYSNMWIPNAGYSGLPDSETQNVFRQIIARLRGGGEFIGYTNFSHDSWAADRSYQNDLKKFFNKEHAVLSMESNAEGNAIMHVVKR